MIQANWKTAFTLEALQYGIKERALALDKEIGEVIDISQVTIPNNETHIPVGWDSFRISEVGKDRPPYSKEFGPCIAILARAFVKNSTTPSYLAVHHVFMQPHHFENTLKALEEKMTRGTIQIFITAGMQKESGPDRSTLIDIIDERRMQNPEIDIELSDDTFGIADLGSMHKVVKGMCYQETCGVGYVGFNEQFAPFQIVSLTAKHNFDLNSIDRILWI